VKANAKPAIAGTTRHLYAVPRDNRQPHGIRTGSAAGAEISNDTIPVELGRFWAGEYGSPTEAMDSIKEHYFGRLGSKSAATGLSQWGHLRGGCRTKRSRMACLTAGMLGCGGGPPILFFRPAFLRRRDWRNA